MAFIEQIFFPKIPLLKFTAIQFDGVLDFELDSDNEFYHNGFSFIVSANSLLLNKEKKDYILIEKEDWIIFKDDEITVLPNKEFQYTYNVQIHTDIEKALLAFKPLPELYKAKEDNNQYDSFSEYDNNYNCDCDFLKQHLLDCVAMLKGIFKNPDEYFSKYSEMSTNLYTLKNNILYQDKYKEAGKKIINHVLDNNLMTKEEICKLLNLTEIGFNRAKNGEYLLYATELYTICENLKLSFSEFFVY